MSKAYYQFKAEQYGFEALISGTAIINDDGNCVPENTDEITHAVTTYDVFDFDSLFLN